MDTERWLKLEEIFHSVLAVKPELRSEFIRRACLGDQQLEKEVLALVESFQDSDDLLEAPAISDFSKLLEGKERESIVGKKVGPYQILREIARGGMGTVYLACRADDQYKKQVALKWILPGMGSDLIIQRFRNERQILANLDHPNIARLLDGGVTGDGTPYLIMDYVEGQPFDTYCDANKLSIEARLRLFRTICSAVHYAHQNLVIHRDIKPDNILVTPQGVPKLLDFGIAKLIDADPESVNTGLTIAGTRVMTPDYASPEQVRGETITTASDTYSLGVLLYKLLTGHPPYRFKTPVSHEVERVICEENPEKPSVHTQKLRKQLEGDLDNIILMAMRKDPQRRYASVEQFSEDIRRHLEGLPVIARKDTLSYRSGKFLKRHKAGAAATVLFFLILIGGIFATARQARIAARERDKARVEAEKARQINVFVERMLGSADPEADGKDIKVVQLLDRAAHDMETQFGNQPEVQASLRTTIGMTYSGLGLYDEAEPILRSALDQRLKLYGPDNAEVAMSKNNLASLMMNKGDLDSAEPLLQDALRVLQKVHGKNHAEVASVMINLADLYLAKGDLKKAEQLNRTALDVRRKILGPMHVDLAQSLNDLAVVLGTKGDYVEAERLHREALSILKKIRGPESPEIAITLSTLASVLASQKQYDAAIPLQQEALAMRRKLLGNDHPLVAWTIYNYGYLLYEDGDYEAAKKLAREILGLRGTKLPDSHPMIPSSLQLLARCLMEQGKVKEAEPLLEESLKLRQQTLPSDHWLIASSESVLGDCLRRLGQYEKAEPLLVKSHKKLQTILGDQHSVTKDAQKRIGLLYSARKK